MIIALLPFPHFLSQPHFLHVLFSSTFTCFFYPSPCTPPHITNYSYLILGMPKYPMIGLVLIHSGDLSPKQGDAVTCPVFFSVHSTAEGTPNCSLKKAFGPSEQHSHSKQITCYSTLTLIFVVLYVCISSKEEVETHHICEKKKEIAAALTGNMPE